MDFRDLTDEASYLAEIGRRLARRRIEMGLTQAVVAEQAGIGKRTLERMEAGQSVQLSNFLRVIRVLGWLEGLERLLPDSGPRPMDLLKLKDHERKRASSKPATNEPWRWGDEP